jgi:peptidoglycan/xylan/chitin deacetylase (PgdA/CDA1 family)
MIAGLDRFRAAAGRAKRRFVPTAIVLMYHRVASVESDVWNLAVSPSSFDQHLQIMRHNGVRLMTMGELAGLLADGEVPRRSAAITFDDGYVDNLTEAQPILERYDAPATLFVTAGEVGSPKGFWWDRLQQMLLGGSALPDRLELHSKCWDVPVDREGRTALYHEVWRLLAAQHHEERTRSLAHLEQWARQSDESAAARIMNEEELRQVGDAGLVEIGSHAWTHSRLGDMAADAQHGELKRSKARLEDIVGHRISGFSYPHGSRSAASGAIARECGYAYACGSRPGLVRRGTDPFDVPRLVVHDARAEAFERFLADHLLS